LLLCHWLLIDPVEAATPASLLQGFGQAKLIIETSGLHCITLDSYLADSPQQKVQGLMFIRQLGEMEGMLFRYRVPTRMLMWMKNTFVPLDMIFADAQGMVTGIVHDTEPLSTKTIASPDATAWVLEVNAGFARRWKIEPGSRLRLFVQGKAGKHPHREN